MIFFVFVCWGNRMEIMREVREMKRILFSVISFINDDIGESFNLF